MSTKKNHELCSSVEIAKRAGVCQVTAMRLIQSGVFGTPVDISTGKKRRHFRARRVEFERWMSRTFPKLPLFEE